MNEVFWRWNTKFTNDDYKTLCPEGFKFNRIEGRLTKNIMLESQGCTRIQMEIIECLCTRTIKDVRDNLTTWIKKWLNFVRGVNGEVYIVSPPGKKTKCNDPLTLTIKDCIVNGEFLPKDFSEIEELFFKNREGK